MTVTDVGIFLLVFFLGAWVGLSLSRRLSRRAPRRRKTIDGKNRERIERLERALYELENLVKKERENIRFLSDWAKGEKSRILSMQSQIKKLVAAAELVDRGAR